MLLLIVTFITQALTFPKWRHPSQSVSYSLMHPTSHRTATILRSSIYYSIEDVSKRMEAIEWCLMTMGKNDEAPPIDIPDFVLCYKNVDKDILEMLYVDLERQKTALQEEETTPLISSYSQADIGNEGTWNRI